MINFVRRLIQKSLPTNQQRIDALTFAVIRGEMTIQELQVELQTKQNNLEIMEIAIREHQQDFKDKLRPIITDVESWAELAEELKSENIDLE